MEPAECTSMSISEYVPSNLRRLRVDAQEQNCLRNNVSFPQSTAMVLRLRNMSRIPLNRPCMNVAHSPYNGRRASTNRSKMKNASDFAEDPIAQLPRHQKRSKL